MPLLDLRKKADYKRDFHIPEALGCGKLFLAVETYKHDPDASIVDLAYKRMKYTKVQNCRNEYFHESVWLLLNSTRINPEETAAVSEEEQDERHPFCNNSQKRNYH